MTESTNRPFLIAIIVIGVIIILLLLNPRTSMMTTSRYSYGTGNLFTASVIPLDGSPYQNVDNSPGHYTITKTYVQPTVTTTPRSYTSYTTYTTTPSYTSYPQTTYESYPGETVFPDGCTLTSPRSTTTGLPCS